MGWGPDPADGHQLERYTYLASVTLGARTTKPFLVRGVPAAELHHEHRHPDGLAELERAITHHGGRGSVAETIAALDEHDERILRHLRALRRDGVGASVESTAPEHSRAGGGRSLRANEVATTRRKAVMSASTSTTSRPLPAAAGEVLEGLYQHRLLSVAQVRAMHAPHASLRWTQQLLRSLAEHGLIDAVRVGRGARKLYFITAAGADAVEQLPTRVETRRKLITPAQALGPLRAHTLAVNEVGIAFQRAAQHRGDECGPFAWRHEVAHPIGALPGRRRGELLICDAVLHYLLYEPNDELTFQYRFLELDRGTIPVDELGAKIARYARLHCFTPDPAAGETAGARPAWEGHYPVFPDVLCVLAHQPRSRLERRLRTTINLCRTDPLLQRESAVQVWLCLLDDLRADGPFAPIFVSHRQPTQLVDWLGADAPTSSRQRPGA